MNRSRKAGRRAAPGRCLLAIAIILCPAASCRNAAGPNPVQSMAEQELAVGVWRKVTTSPCSARYPDVLELREGGLYAGSKEPAGTFTEWDAGTWRADGPGRVQISTANDAIIGYTYSVSGKVVTFRDPEGCEFQYRQSG